MLSKENLKCVAGIAAGAVIGVAVGKKLSSRKLEQVEQSKRQMYEIMSIHAKRVFDSMLNAYEQQTLNWFVKSDALAIERGNAIADTYNKILEDHTTLMGLGLNYAVKENEIPRINAKGPRYHFNTEPLDFIDMETWEEQNL